MSLDYTFFDVSGMWLIIPLLMGLFSLILNILEIIDKAFNLFERIHLITKKRLQKKWICRKVFNNTNLTM